MGCVDFTRLRWPSQIWVFEGSLSITSSIPFAGSGTTRHAVLQLNASSGRGKFSGTRSGTDVSSP
jgi:hypothetical protein